MMRRFVPIMLFLLVAFLMVLPLMAQDATPEATVGSNPPVVSTDVPVVTNPPIVVQQPSELDSILKWVFDILLVVSVVYLAYKQGNLTSPATLDKIFSFLQTVTTAIPGENDDKLLGITEEVVRRWARDEQAKVIRPQFAELTVVESQAMATKEEVEALSKKLAEHQQYYPISFRQNIKDFSPYNPPDVPSEP